MSDLFLIVEPVGNLCFFDTETAGNKCDGFVEVHRSQTSVVACAGTGAVVESAFDVAALVAHVQRVLAMGIEDFFAGLSGFAALASAFAVRVKTS